MPLSSIPPLSPLQTPNEWLLLNSVSETHSSQGNQPKMTAHSHTAYNRPPCLHVKLREGILMPKCEGLSQAGAGFHGAMSAS